jgi:hypothetical protein
LEPALDGQGFAPSTIHRIWKAFDLQPHRTETFKLSTDPPFVEKVRDIVGPVAAGARAGSFASTKRAKSRRWIERSRFCPCARGKSSGAPTTIRAPELLY